jgi:predicted RNase H-like HicB family nuclease
MTTTHEYRGYLFQITYRPEDPAYSVDFPDIPDIITSGPTLSDAFAMACEALDLHLESLQKLNLPLPRCRHRLVVESVG